MRHTYTVGPFTVHQANEFSWFQSRGYLPDELGTEERLPTGEVYLKFTEPEAWTFKEQVDEATYTCMIPAMVDKFIEFEGSIV